MRYPASEKLEIIRLVEQSHQPVKKTLEQIGVSRPTFYRWYDLYRRFGEAALEDRRGGSGRVWNRIPSELRDQVLDMALDEPDLSPRELATRFTDERRYFVSEASVYRLLKAHDLITSPAFIVMKAANEFKDKTRRSNQLLSIQALSPQSLSEAIAEAVSNTEAGSNPPLRTVKDLKGKGQPIDFEELAEVLGRVSHERSKS